jgi:hypothetical protein
MEEEDWDDHGEDRKTSWRYSRFLDPIHKQETVFGGGGRDFFTVALTRKYVTSDPEPAIISGATRTRHNMITILPSITSMWSVMGTTEYISISYKGPSK